MPCPSDTSETLVLYHPGQVALALDVMKYLSGAVMMQVTPSIAARHRPGRPGVQRQRNDNAPATATSASTVPSTAFVQHCPVDHLSQEVRR